MSEHLHRAIDLSDDEEDLGEFEQDNNSFEERNQIFQLKSEVNSLRKALLESKAHLETKDINIHQLELQCSKLREESQRMQMRLKEEIEQKEMMRQQLGNLNRKTAQFYKSSGYEGNYEDPTDLIQDLLKKDQLIKNLQQKIKGIQKQSVKNHSQDKLESTYENDRLKAKNKELQEEIDILKERQIKYKKDNDEMLLSKQEVIKKMEAKNQEHTRKMIDYKDKIIEGLRNQISELVNNSENQKKEIKILTQRTLVAQNDANRMRNQFLKKEENLIHKYENEKEEVGNSMSANMKKMLSQKHQKFQQLQFQYAELENENLRLKQEQGKLKAENASLKQFNGYLQTSSKQADERKIKVQKDLDQKDRFINQLKQNHISQIHEVKRQYESSIRNLTEKMTNLDEQITLKNLQIQRFGRKIQSAEKQKANSVEVIKLKEKLVEYESTNQKLRQDYQTLKVRYTEKSETLLNTEKRLRNEFKQRIQGLQNQLHRLKLEEKEYKTKYIKQTTERNITLEEEHQKLKRIHQITELDNKQLNIQIKKAKDQVRENRKKLSETQNERINLKQDLRNLQEQHDQLNDKYKKVSDLQERIEQMTEQIEHQRKRFDRKKNQYEYSEEKQASDIQKYKHRIRQLENNMQEEKYKYKQNMSIMETKIEKLSNETEALTRQKNYTLKARKEQQAQQEEIMIGQKQKLQEYISQLQNNNQILNQKLVNMQKANKKQTGSPNLQKQHLELKVEYSESLRQINIILQKYKKLEQVHKQILDKLEITQDQYDKINEKYVQVYKEKNKIIDELNSAYDQINKLNLVLMSKEEQLTKTKIQNCPHITPNKYTMGSSFIRNEDYTFKKREEPSGWNARRQPTSHRSFWKN